MFGLYILDRYKTTQSSTYMHHFCYSKLLLHQLILHHLKPIVTHQCHLLTSDILQGESPHTGSKIKILIKRQVSVHNILWIQI